MSETIEKLAYSIEEATDALGVGRTHMFDLLRRGEIDSIKSGRRRLIPVSALRAYLARESDLPEAG